MTPQPLSRRPGTSPSNRPCIICGTDFSAGAAEAIDAAAALATLTRQKLLLVHSVAETFRDQFPDETRQALIPTLQSRLHAEAERARQLGATVEEAVLPGWPDDGIQERASESHAGLIVFGYPEIGALNRWLRGSVAETIAESSSIPTLVVHSAAPFEKCVRAERPLRILVAIDLTPASDAPLQWAAQLRERLPCDITLACVQRESPDRSGREQRSRHTRLPVHGFASHVRIIPESAHVEEHLIRLSGEISADLLVIGTHEPPEEPEQHWPRSLSRELLRRAPISVACIPNSSTTEFAAATYN